MPRRQPSGKNRYPDLISKVQESQCSCLCHGQQYPCMMGTDVTMDVEETRYLEGLIYGVSGTWARLV